MLVLAILCASAARAGEAPDWTVAGRLGLMQMVIVSEARVADEALYRAAVDQLCPPDATCFLRFFTNSSGVPATVPLPDAIAAEPAALFSRSAKHVQEVFQWSCRVKPGSQGCF